MHRGLAPCCLPRSKSRVQQVPDPPCKRVLRPRVCRRHASTDPGSPQRALLRQPSRPGRWADQGGRLCQFPESGEQVHAAAGLPARRTPGMWAEAWGCVRDVSEGSGARLGCERGRGEHLGNVRLQRPCRACRSRMARRDPGAPAGCQPGHLKEQGEAEGSGQPGVSAQPGGHGVSAARTTVGRLPRLPDRVLLAPPSLGCGMRGPGGAAPPRA